MTHCGYWVSHQINKHIGAGVAKTVSEEEWEDNETFRDIRTASAIFRQFHTELCSMSTGKNLEALICIRGGCKTLIWPLRFE